VTVYRIDGAASGVVVEARSSIHDTRTRWSGVAGTIEADPAELAAATAELTVDMTRHDAGDFLRNRKLRKDLHVDRYPTARFRLVRLRDVADRGGGSFAATADGVIAWHDREVEIAAAGEGAVTADRIAATARFELDVRAFGVEPPRFLMFKVEEVVAVTVTLLARP
jgi:polyisoprenoid-binding protein YceI